jgi:hypothetical protein
MTSTQKRPDGFPEIYESVHPLGEEVVRKAQLKAATMCSDRDDLREILAALGLLPTTPKPPRKTASRPRASGKSGKPTEANRAKQALKNRKARLRRKWDAGKELTQDEMDVLFPDRIVVPRKSS